jgi:hypothetical protein
MAETYSINIQIRTVKPVSALRAGYLAILLNHFVSATIANINMFVARHFAIPMHWL